MTLRTMMMSLCAVSVMAIGSQAFAAGGKNTTQPSMTCAGVLACAQLPPGSFVYPNIGVGDNRGDHLRGDGDWHRGYDPRVDGNWRRDSRENDWRYRNRGPFGPYGQPGPVKTGVPF